MKPQPTQKLRHEHVFKQDRKRPGENRTLLVVAITAVMMVVEIVAGLKYGSMALLADGLHMGSHAMALGITVFAYAYARKHANNAQFSFGTGKVNALGGFSGAVLLSVFALMMAFESVSRLLDPQEIVFELAIIVAVVGLVVNAICAYILRGGSVAATTVATSAAPALQPEKVSAAEGDQNLKSAYLHVLVDAMTSLLAIFALLTAKLLNANWIDAMVGLIGAALIARWSLQLIQSTSTVLLDHQVTQPILDSIRSVLEDQSTEVTDLHVWSIGPDIYSAQITVLSSAPESPDIYKAKIPPNFGVVHVSIEVHVKQ